MYAKAGERCAHVNRKCNIIRVGCAFVAVLLNATITANRIYVNGKKRFFETSTIVICLPHFATLKKKRFQEMHVIYSI